MDALSDARLVSAFKSISMFAGVIAGFVGCLVLFGWAFDITSLKSVYPGWVTMKANTAIAFALAGISLWLLPRSQESVRLRRVAQACALTAALLGLLNVAEYLLTRDLGIDQLLFTDPTVAPVPPGRMALSTAISFVTVGSALLLLVADARRSALPAHLLTLAAALLSLLSLVGYAYSVEELYSFGPYSAMAMHTALTFGILSTGILLAYPDRGLMAMVTNDAPGGLMVRRLVPAVIFVPPVLGWAALMGQRAGLWDPSFAQSLFAVLNVVVFAGLVGFSASALYSLDLKRKEAEQALRRAHDELERRVEERTAELAADNKDLRAEAAERERVTEEQDRFFTLSLDMLCIAGFDGYFKRINQAFEKTLGYTAEELVAKPFVEFIHPDDRAATLAVVQNLATGAPLLYFENRYRCKDGSYRWLEWTAVPELTTRVIYAVARDVTEQKLAQAEIRKLNEELERRVIERTAQLQAANKELEAFAYSVSHDLRAPLRHIDGFSQALLEDYADELDEQGKEYLGFVREASQSMAQLIDDLLKLSRVTRAEMRLEPVDLSALAQQVAAELHDQQPKRQVDFVIAPGVVANGDLRLLLLALENLIGNAWKFTSKRPRARIEFGLTQQDGRPVYYVRDNGAGFDMAYVGKLFSAFQRLHSTEEFPGTGIGLATVQRIIHRHGGRVWAEGAVDRGATFYFTL